jgi:SAM-dependent methyltransferase
VKISAQIRSQILRDIEEFCRSVRRVDPEEALSYLMADEYLSSQTNYYLAAFRRHGVEPRSSRILEIGSGYGLFLSYARSTLRWNVWGIEPGQAEFGGRHELASRILSLNGVERWRLVRCAGEHLPFRGGSFDAVISNDVLEHVGDPEAVIRESARAVRPGGLLVFNIPNYHWIYEGHYNTPWIPSMPKPLARRYVALLGRDPAYLDSLNFLSPAIVRRMLGRIPDLEMVSPLEEGCADFFPQRIGAYLQTAGTRAKPGASLRFFRALHWFSRQPAFKGGMRVLAGLTGLYHEMHLVARKREGPRASAQYTA